MSGFRRSAVTGAAAAVALAVTASTVFAGGIEAGLWKITSIVRTGGVTGPPRQTSKCLTAQDVRDLPTTFSPIANTINSTCAPIERSFDGTKLSWHLVCKGQFNMQLDGAFDFDGAHHYTGTVRTKASLAGRPMPDLQQTLEAEWVSACRQ
jgi:hypothetical protein